MCHSDQDQNISIHSLHTEGDRLVDRYFRFNSDFNPLPPHGGRLIFCENRSDILYFNPLPPHGGRPIKIVIRLRDQNISIHSLHTEGDLHISLLLHLQNAFQSTPSTRRETETYAATFREDLFQSTPSTRRETPTAFTTCNQHLFQSTPSTRRETILEIRRIAHRIFQSTPSTRRETVSAVLWILHFQYFNPLPPHGGRPMYVEDTSYSSDISIHSLHTEGDVML